MATRIQLRRDSSTNWSSVNPVLAQGEIGFEIDKNKIKIGDGATTWNALPYVAGGESGSTTWGQIVGTLSNQTDLQNALNQKQPVIADLATIISNALAGKQASETIATYGDIVIHNTAEFATAAQGTKADNALPNTTKYAINLNYANNKLQLRDQNGNALGDEIIITSGGGATWGAIGGTLSDQTDLNQALAGKQPTITDLDDIRAHATAGNTAKTTIDTYGDIVTHNASEFQVAGSYATAAQGAKADAAATTIATYGDIVTHNASEFQAAGNYATAAQGAKADAAATAIATYGDVVTHDADEFATAAQGAKADTAATTIAGYGDIVTHNASEFQAAGEYATAAQGAKADAAATTIATYGDIVTHNTSEFATAAQGAKADTATTTIAGYGDIVTHNASEFQAAGEYATAAQGAKADTALQEDDILDVYTSTATDKALSANKGKDLNDRLNNVEGRGRFLSTWNCKTGKPGTDPSALPYTYKSGDYYVVGTVAASTGTNYKPTGTSYTGEASTVEETNKVKKNDTYLFDGTEWIWQNTAQQTVAFANIAGEPTDNTNLATALGEKQDEIDDLDDIRSNATAGKGASTTIAGYGDVVTHNASEFATSAQGTKADNALPNTTKYAANLNYSNDKLQLKDQDGTALGTQVTIKQGHTISYNSTTEELTFA